MTRRSRERTGGFVLLMTLVMLVLVAIAAAGLVRTSLAKAVEAQQAERDLQRRWAVTTASSTALATAERALAEAQADASEPVTRLAWSADLAGGTLRLIVDEEQAKVNVNHILETETPGEAERAARALASSGRALRVRLRPGRDETGGRLVIEDLPQVFVDSRGRSDRSFDDLAASTEKLTCWGSGQVNLLRARRDVLQEQCRGALSPTELDDLLAARAEKPNATLGELLQAVELKPASRAAAGRLLTDRPSAWSCLLEWGDGRRRWLRHDVAIRQVRRRPGADGKPESSAGIDRRHAEW